jgi:hypothetical protein
MATPPKFEPVLIHAFKNHLAVIMGFCELLIAECPEGALRDDLGEIHRATSAAIALMPQLAEHFHE